MNGNHANRHTIDPLKVELRPLTTLTPAARNARRHSDKQIEQVAASISHFGFTNPIIIEADGTIVAGHARFEASKALGIVDVPTIQITHLTPAELRAYRLADNKIPANADWDPEILRIELEELVEIETRYDIEITGFSTTEIDLLLDVSPAEAKLEEQPSLDRKEVPGVEQGDVWILGSHRLLCGDSRDPASFDRLMDLEQARMVFSDPPFNVKVDGHVGGLGRTKHAEFAMASGEMTESEFTGFLRTVFANASEVSINGAIHYQCMDWRHAGEMLSAGHAVYSGLQNLCVWAKDNGGMGSFYRSQHELVFVWKVGEAPHLNTVQLGRNGRYRTNVWNYRGPPRSGRMPSLPCIRR